MKLQKGVLTLSLTGEVAELRYDGNKSTCHIKQANLLFAMTKLVKDVRLLQGVVATYEGASFSATRQITTLLNVLAWQLGIRVNGKKRLAARYDREPNITKPKSVN